MAVDCRRKVDYWSCAKVERRLLGLADRLTGCLKSCGGRAKHLAPDQAISGDLKARA